MEPYIQHHGIQGQKWGVRRTPEELGHAPSGDKAKGGGEKLTIKKVAGAAGSSIGSGFSSVKNAIKARQAAKKPVKKLSDEELRTRVNRLQMEKQYSELLAAEKERERGIVSKAVGKALSTFGNTLVTGIATYAANRVLEGVKNAGKDDEPASTKTVSSKEKKEKKGAKEPKESKEPKPTSVKDLREKYGL